MADETILAEAPGLAFHAALKECFSIAAKGYTATTRPPLECVEIVFDDHAGTIQMVTTDGFRATRRSVQALVFSPRKLLLKPDHVKAILKGKLKGKHVAISIDDDDEVRITWDGGSATSKRSDLQYPNMDLLWPKPATLKTHWTFKTDELRESLAFPAHMAKTSQEKVALMLEPLKKGIAAAWYDAEVSSKRAKYAPSAHIEGGSTLYCKVEREEDGIKAPMVPFDPRYLLDAVGLCDSSTITIHFSGENSASIIGQDHLLMPMAFGRDWRPKKTWETITAREGGK